MQILFLELHKKNSLTCNPATTGAGNWCWAASPAAIGLQRETRLQRGL